MKRSEELARLVRFYETLTPGSLSSELGSIYSAKARFKDPFNEVEGLAAIEAIFRHMYAKLESPRFVVRLRMTQEDDAFLTWDFTFRMGRNSQRTECIRGATHVLFGDDGRVVDHRDYWDAAEELYEKLPVLGSFMRYLKRAANR